MPVSGIRGHRSGAFTDGPVTAAIVKQPSQDRERLVDLEGLDESRDVRMRVLVAALRPAGGASGMS